MRRNSQYLLFLTLVISSTFWSIIVLYKNRNQIWLPSLVNSRFSGGKCKSEDHVYFLKTHQCNSDIVQNILMRRGLDRGLKFVLPKVGLYLGHPEHFNPDHHIDPELTLPYGHNRYDILTHYTRYDSFNVRRVLPRGTKHITILQDPATLFESLYSYYELAEKLYRNLQFDDMIMLKDDIIKAEIFDQPKRYEERIGTNQMAFDIGMDPSYFLETNDTKELLQYVTSEFDLVLIAEYMEASLILLADLMCWPLEAVSFLNINIRPLYDRIPMDQAAIEKLHKLNNVDSKLYNHFLQIFKLKIIEYGETRMQNDVLKLINLNNNLYQDCVLKKRIKREKTGKTYPVFEYTLRANAPKSCKYLLMNEMDFTMLLRNQHILKFSTLKNLQLLTKFVHK